MKVLRICLVAPMAVATAASALTVIAVGCGGTPAVTEPSSPTSEELESMGRHRRTSAPDVGEEEPDDGMQIEGLGGRLDPYDIQQGIEPKVADLNRCHTRELGRHHYVGGKIEMAFVVAPDGSVKRVHLNHSNLGAHRVESCLLDVARGLIFPEPRGGGDADFTLPLEFRARRASDIWEQSVSQSEADAHVSSLAACANPDGADTSAGTNTGTNTDGPAGTGVTDTAMTDTGSKSLSLPATISVTVYVGARGQALSAGFAAVDGPIDDAWVQCAAGAISAWMLSDPRGRIAKMQFTYQTMGQPEGQAQGPTQGG